MIMHPTRGANQKMKGWNVVGDRLVLDWSVGHRDSELQDCMLAVLRNIAQTVQRLSFQSMGIFLFFQHNVRTFILLCHDVKGFHNFFFPEVCSPWEWNTEDRLCYTRNGSAVLWRQPPALLTVNPCFWVKYDTVITQAAQEDSKSLPVCSAI